MTLELIERKGQEYGLPNLLDKYQLTCVNMKAHGNAILEYASIFATRFTKNNGFVDM